MARHEWQVTCSRCKGTGKVTLDEFVPFYAGMFIGAILALGLVVLVTILHSSMSG